MSKMGMVCGIADVHYSKLEEYFSLFPLYVFISSSAFSENKRLSLNKERPSRSLLCQVKHCLKAVVENSPVYGRIV